MKKPQQSGKKAPAGNKNTKNSEITRKKQKKNKYLERKTNILEKNKYIEKKQKTKTEKKTNNIGHIWPYIWP